MGRKRRRQQIARGVGVGAGATLLMGGTAHADVFTVDSLQDAPDDGHTTLRDAIADAEKPAASGSTVTFASGLSGTIHLGSQLPDIVYPNGGPTQTMKPAATSPVVDRGSAFGLGTDQRGSVRPFDAPTIANGSGDASDMGAVELQATEVPAASATGAPALKKKCKKEAQALGRERQEEEVQEKEEVRRKPNASKDLVRVRARNSGIGPGGPGRCLRGDDPG